MSAQIIQFPGREAQVHPQSQQACPTDENLRPALRKAISSLGAGWLFNGQGVQMHASNYLRNHFCVRSVAAIPSSRLQEAIDIVRAMQDKAWDFMLTVSAAKRAFLDDCIGAGTPWTPAVQRKVGRSLIPECPDWQELAKSVGMRMEENLDLNDCEDDSEGDQEVATKYVLDSEMEELAQMIADRARPGARKPHAAMESDQKGHAQESELGREMDPMAERIAKRAKEIMVERAQAVE